MSSIAMRALCLLFVTFVFAGATAVHAEVLRFEARLSGAAEVPPNTSRATGQAEFQFNTATHQLTFAIVYDDLTGPATAGHIHGPGRTGVNAPAIVAFGVPDSPINGTATLTPAQAAALIGGELYVNIHTARYRDGEIRGQIAR